MPGFTGGYRVNAKSHPIEFYLYASAGHKKTWSTAKKTLC
jgi:hypothetical protein